MRFVPQKSSIVGWQLAEGPSASDFNLGFHLFIHCAAIQHIHHVCFGFGCRFFLNQEQFCVARRFPVEAPGKLMVTLFLRAHICRDKRLSWLQHACHRHDNQRQQGKSPHGTSQTLRKLSLSPLLWPSLLLLSPSSSAPALQWW